MPSPSSNSLKVEVSPLLDAVNTSSPPPQIFSEIVSRTPGSPYEEENSFLPISIDDQLMPASYFGNSSTHKNENNTTEQEEDKEKLENLENLDDRTYQTVILKNCEKENLIVVLPTGAGKTLIAVRLLKNRIELEKNRINSSGGRKKIAVFLANKIPLLRQQLDYIKNHSLVKSKAFFG